MEEITLYYAAWMGYSGTLWEVPVKKIGDNTYQTLQETSWFGPIGQIHMANENYTTDKSEAIKRMKQTGLRTVNTLMGSIKTCMDSMKALE